MLNRSAIKVAAEKNQIAGVYSLINQFGLKGIEVQEVIEIMNKKTAEERSNLLIENFKDLGIKYLSYHFPIKSKWDNLKEAKEMDLASGRQKIRKLSRETIREAALVASALNIKSYIPVNFHLFGFVDEKEVSIDKKKKLLFKGEKALLELKQYAEEISREYGLMKEGNPLIFITRENNPPVHGNITALLDYHPQEIARTKNKGIKCCLDLAHYKQYINYLKSDNQELKGVNLDRELYSADIDWKFVFNYLRDCLGLVHINDAKGYAKKDEGIECGTGEIDFAKVLKYLTKVNELSNIINTIEIKDGHNDLSKVKRSIDYVRGYID